MSTQEKDPLQAVLHDHEVKLEDLRFMSLTGARLHIDRMPVREHIRRGNEVYTEVRPLDPFVFEDGLYPPPGETMTEDEARELVTSPFFDEVTRERKNLFRVAPKAPPSAKSIDEQIEERAASLAEQKVQQLLKARGIDPSGGGTPPPEGEPETPPAPPPEGGKESDPEPPSSDDDSGGKKQEVITGVSTKQEAVEALASRNVDVSFASNLANTTVDTIVAKASAAGYRFDGWGD